MRKLILAAVAGTAFVALSAAATDASTAAKM